MHLTRDSHHVQLLEVFGLRVQASMRLTIIICADYWTDEACDLRAHRRWHRLRGLLRLNYQLWVRAFEIPLCVFTSVRWYRGTSLIKTTHPYDHLRSQGIEVL